MATKLYMQAVNSDVSNYTLADKVAPTTSLTTAVTNTVAGPTSGVQMTKTAGGTVIKWLSPPLAGTVTLSGNCTLNGWAQESATAANAGLEVRVLKYSGGAEGSTVLDSERGTELTASITQQNWTASATSTAFAIGDRIMVSWYINDAGGNMTASSRNVTLDYAGSSSGADGDTWIQFTQDPKFTYDSTLSQSITISETATGTALFDKSNSDSVTLSDSVSNTYGRDYSITISDFFHVLSDCDAANLTGGASLFSEPFTYSNGNLWGKGSWIQGAASFSPVVTSNKCVIGGVYGQTYQAQAPTGLPSTFQNSVGWSGRATFNRTFVTASDGQDIYVKFGTGATPALAIRFTGGDGANTNQIRFLILGGASYISGTNLSDATNYVCEMRYSGGVGSEVVTCYVNNSSVFQSTPNSVLLTDDGTSNVIITGYEFSATSTVTIDDVYIGLTTVPSDITHFQNNSDSLDLTETIDGTVVSAGTTYDNSTSESITISEISSNICVFDKSNSDSYTLSETSSNICIFDKSNSDSVTLSETSTGNGTFDKSNSDSVTISDAATHTLTVNSSASETLTLSDLSSHFLITEPSISDNFTLSDSDIGNGTFDKSTSDSVTLSDTISHTLQIDLSNSDSVTLAATTSHVLAIDVSNSDSYTFTDSISNIAIFDKSVSDSTTLSDVSSQVLTIDVSGSDSYTLSDTSSNSLVLNPSNSDAVTLSDSLISQATNFVTSSDSLSLSAETEYLGFIDEFANEAISLSTSLSNEVIFTSFISDSISIADITSNSLTISVTDSDSVSLSDTPSNVLIVSASNSDAVTLLDTTSLGGQIDESLSESITISESDSNLVQLENIISNSITLTDQIFQTAILNILDTDSITLDDESSSDLQSAQSTFLINRRRLLRAQ